jgi:hypothetical protein
MEFAVGYHSLTTTTHPSIVNLLFSGQQNTTLLSARKISVADGNRAQDPLLRDATGYWGSISSWAKRFRHDTDQSHSSNNEVYKK